MRQGAHPAFACIGWNYRLLWRLIHRAGTIELGTQEFHALNRSIRFVISALRGCPRRRLLNDLSCPTQAGRSQDPACKSTTCCSFSGPWSWGSVNGKLLKECTARAHQCITLVSSLQNANSCFPHAPMGRVLGFDGPTPAWRAGLTEWQSTRLMNSFFEPDPGFTRLMYVYRPTAAWCLCIGLYDVTAQAKGFYHCAAF